jgi:hypothetical protein
MSQNTKAKEGLSFMNCKENVTTPTVTARPPRGLQFFIIVFVVTKYATVLLECGIVTIGVIFVEAVI